MIYKSFEKEIPEGYEARIEGNKVIFEPKENEDERIERDILKTLRYGLASEESALMPGAKTTLREAIAYLEKQKDFQFGYPGIYFYDGEKLHFQGNPAMEERQKEQKPVEGTALQKAFINSKSYTLEEKCDASDYAETILPTSVTYGENEEEYKLHKIIEAAFIAGQKKEQKPAEWSEEDEDMIRFYEMDYNNQIGDWPAKKVVEMRLAFKDWLCVRLKSLRPQPKQEWSEEDKTVMNEMREHFVRMLGDRPDFSPNQMYSASIQFIDKLTSICPKLRWKPSEEQIKALNAVANEGVLLDLFNDLLKLF